MKGKEGYLLLCTAGSWAPPRGNNDQWVKIGIDKGTARRKLNNQISVKTESGSVEFGVAVK